MAEQRTSVVLTTFNGIRYIKEQLDSLRDQTIPFDEVIIMDDCSSDGTVEFIKGYIDENRLLSWRLIRNETNQGWKKNFKLGFEIATGDYIFPCDQDDIWHLNKNEKMIRELKRRPKVDVLVSNFTLFFSENDRGSVPYQSTAKRMVNDGTVYMLELDPKWSYISRPGCVYCFRKSFYEELKIKWNTNYAHDAILWRYARIKKTLALYNESLVDFRRHGDNATSIKQRTREERIQTFDDYLYFHKEAMKYELSKQEKKIIHKGMNFLLERKKMYQSRNPLYIFDLIFRYGRYYLNKRGIAGDFYFIIRERQG